MAHQYQAAMLAVLRDELEQRVSRAVPRAMALLRHPWRALPALAAMEQPAPAASQAPKLTFWNKRDWRLEAGNWDPEA